MPRLKQTHAPCSCADAHVIPPREGVSASALRSELALRPEPQAPRRSDCARSAGPPVPSSARPDQAQPPGHARARQAEAAIYSDEP
jgi:hypothetical protein